MTNMAHAVLVIVLFIDMHNADQYGGYLLLFGILYALYNLFF